MDSTNPDETLGRRHDFTRRIISRIFDRLRARGFLFIQLEELLEDTIRGEIEARGMNLRHLRELIKRFEQRAQKETLERRKKGEKKLQREAGCSRKLRQTSVEGEQWEPSEDFES